MRKLKITELNRISAEEFKQAEKLPLVVVLDDIRSLHNIGSVFRTSDAFRIECIYLCGITATPPHPEMHKTALGAEFTVDWKYVDNAVDAVDNLRKDGYMVYSVEQAEGSIMLDELELTEEEKPVEVKKTGPVNLTELQKVLDQKIAARKMGVVDLEKEEVRKVSKMEAEKLDSEE